MATFLRIRILILLTITACSGSDTMSPSMDAGSNSPVDVVGSVFDVNGRGIPNARVCVLHHSEIPCQITDDEGDYTMRMPSLSESASVAVEATASGFIGSLLLDGSPTDTESAFPTGFGLTSEADATTVLRTWGGFEYPGGIGGGFLRLRLSGAPPGATITLPQLTNVSPVYFDITGTPDPTLTSSTASGFAMFGNVLPGVYDLTVTSQGKTCHVTNDGSPDVIVGDWPSKTGATMSVEIAEGALTENIVILCN